MSATTYDMVLQRIRQQYPKVKVVPMEDSKFMAFVDFIAWWVVLGGNYTTTIGYTIYMSKSLIGTVRGADILEHEAVHVGQWAKWNLLFSLSYLLLLPSVFTFRAHWERKAYEVNLRREKTLTGTISQRTEDAMVRRFCGKDYLWMWPFPKRVRRWVQSFR